MIQSGFFNSVEGDRTYNAEDMSTMYEGIITDGVLRGIGAELNVEPCSPAGMRVSVSSGKAILANKWMRNTEDFIIALEASESLPRIDMVVLEVNYTNREFVLNVKKGIADENPSAPAMEDNAVRKEMPLAKIQVIANAAEITEDDITDLRVYAAVNNIIYPKRECKRFIRGAAYICNAVTADKEKPVLYEEMSGATDIYDMDVDGIHYIRMIMSFIDDIEVSQNGVFIPIILPDRYVFGYHGDPNISIYHLDEKVDATPGIDGNKITQEARAKPDLFVTEIKEGYGPYPDPDHPYDPKNGYIRIRSDGTNNKLDRIVVSFLYSENIKNIPL